MSRRSRRDRHDHQRDRNRGASESTLPKRSTVNPTGSSVERAEPDAASEVASASSPKERHVRAVCFGIGIVAIAVLAIVVQRPYWTAVHFYDDEVHLHHVSQVQMGDRSLVRDLFTLHNEHFLPLWKLGYHFTWRMAGMQPWVWHVGMTGMHVVSAWCLLLLGWRYLSTATAAISAAILWAGVAIAGNDHPLIWIASSHFAMSFTWLLMAMVCVTRLSGSRRWVWFGCMLLAMAASVGTMGSMIFSVAVLPVQYWLLEAPRKNELIRWPVWLCGWGGLSLVLFVVQLSCAAAGLAESAQPTDESAGLDGFLSGLATRDALQGVFATGGAIVVTFNQLLGIPFETIELQSEWPAMLTIAGLVATAVLLRRYVNWRLLLVVWLAPGMFTLMVYLLRSYVDLQTLLSFTRYHYLPCMAWCMTLAIVLDAALSHPWSLRHRATLRPIVGIVLAALLIIYADVQRATAAVSAEAFTTQTKTLREVWGNFDLLFNEAAARASHRSEPTKLPDITVRLDLRQWNLSQMAVVLFPNGLEDVLFVALTNIDAEEKAELLQWLEKSESQLGPHLIQVIEDSNPDT